MQFTSVRRQQTAASDQRACGRCGATLPTNPTGGRPAESLCASCSRPIRLGGARPNLASERPMGGSLPESAPVR